VAVSIVVPVRNEAENVAPLIAEIGAALDGRWPYEIIYVNDGSTDATGERLTAVMKQRGNLRQIRHAISSGQSAAVRSGVRAARGAIVATLDGDGQNNPAFLPELISAIENGGERIGLVAGQRVGRKDTGFKKMQSRVANGVRDAILRDGTRDTGCGLKAFRRDVFLAMPYFDGLHRFLPALVRREGYEIAYVDVIDRPRQSGVSNYGFFDRLWIGIMDLAGVWWLLRRKKPTPVATEVNDRSVQCHRDLPERCLRHQIRRLGHPGIRSPRLFYHAFRGAVDRLGTRAQERDAGGVLVLLDRRRRAAADLRAVSPRPRLHRRPGARARGVLPQSLFHHGHRASGFGQRLSVTPGMRPLELWPDSDAGLTAVPAAAEQRGKQILKTTDSLRAIPLA
jgi:dolichol-phosphate mannosyltransferase